MVRFDIVAQDMRTAIVPPKLLEAEGWHHLGGSLGIDYYPIEGVIRLSNGVYDGDWAGGVFVGCIKLDGVPLGNGYEYLPPQGVLYIDLATGAASPGYATAAEVGGVSIPFSRAAAEMHRARNEPTETERLGALWRVAGVPQSAPPGVEFIEPVCGWQMNGAWQWARHKAVMGRTALDCLAKADGKPIKNPSRPRGYSTSRGWMVTTKLERFCVPVSADPNDDRRAPRDHNTGTCPYRERLLGINRDNGWGPSDDQHLGNSMTCAKALAQVGWRPAKRDLEIMAADISYGMSYPIEYTEHEGSKHLGIRAKAWSMDVLRYNRSLAGFGAELADATAMSLTPAGQCMRVGKNDPEAQGFSPGMWTVGPGMADPLAATEQGGYTYEFFLTCYALASYGKWREARLMIDKLFKSSFLKPSLVRRKGYVPKGIAVGSVSSSAAYSKVEVGCGVPDFMPYIGPGLLACEAIHAGLSPKAYFDYALLIPTPTQGKAKDSRDLLKRLRNEWGGRSQVVALLSALEQHHG